MTSLHLHGHPLSAYFDRFFDQLTDHRSVKATIDQAKPCFKSYPGTTGPARRLFDPAGT